MNDDPINPLHYNQGKMEVIDAIEGLGLGFHEGNTLKYMARAPFKGKEIEDFEKGLWYLMRKLAKRKEELGLPLNNEERKVLRRHE